LYHIETMQGLNLIKIATVVLFLTIRDAIGFATPNSDFLFGIDGASIATAQWHVCVLEQKATEGMGGRAQCWGIEEDSGAQNPPKDVRE
jgi:hypothetical protein